MSPRRRDPRLEARPLLAPASRPAYSSHEVVAEALTAAECDRVLELGDGVEVESASLTGTDVDATRLDRGLRRARVSWLGPGPDTDWLYARLARVVERANRRWRFDLTGFAEDLQLTRYDEPGAFYTWHQDGLDTEVALRKLAVVVQLSDPADYAGADLQLFDVSVDLAPADLVEWTERVRARGTAVVFPAFEYHRVTPLERGGRQSLVAWVSGPPFR